MNLRGGSPPPFPPLTPTYDCILDCRCCIRPGLLLPRTPDGAAAALAGGGEAAASAPRTSRPPASRENRLGFEPMLVPFISLNFFTQKLFSLYVCPSVPGVPVGQVLVQVLALPWILREVPVHVPVKYRVMRIVRLSFVMRKYFSPTLTVPCLRPRPSPRCPCKSPPWVFGRRSALSCSCSEDEKGDRNEQKNVEFAIKMLTKTSLLYVRSLVVGPASTPPARGMLSWRLSTRGDWSSYNIWHQWRASS